MMVMKPLMMVMPSQTTGPNGRTPTVMVKVIIGLTHIGMTPATTTGPVNSFRALKTRTNTL